MPKYYWQALTGPSLRATQLGMFIRKTTHTNNKNGEKYHTYKLVESVRTQRGPRQRTLLNIGNTLNLPKERWKDLADRIESIIAGQLNLFPASAEIEQLAKRYAKKIIRGHGQCNLETLEEKEKYETDFQTVDINSVDNEHIRSVGGESVVLATIRGLELDRKLGNLGFNRPSLDAAIGVIAARLLAPASERATHIWLQSHTALDDLMETSFDALSQDRIYKAADMLIKHKDSIEAHLRNREADLFNLKENILLYDLTNTFFEGSGKYNEKAHFGRSKEKRSDCPLVTLGLAMDQKGFPKRSLVFEGNVSEPGTLEKIVPEISFGDKKPTIITDAGIGTQENIKWMKSHGYDYIVVSRKRLHEIPVGLDLVDVRENAQRLVRAAIRINDDGEMEVYCHSSAKEIKEKSIKTRFEKRFEDALTAVQNALAKKGGTKKHDKVLEKIGRLKEKYRRVARRYEITVVKDTESENAVRIDWRMKPVDDTSGYYVLRTSRTDLTEKEVFDIFTMLLNVEDAFRFMKSELGLRPVHHQTGFRCEGHLFITVLAYHVLQTIRTKLESQGITYSWATIRNLLSTHCRVTTSMRRPDGKMIYIRKTARPEESHLKIYDALGLDHRPGKTTKMIL